MTAENTQPVHDLTKEIQARDGVAVVVYSKNDCFGCTKTKEKLEENSIHYTEVNVEEDETAFKYVTETLGIRQMPVVVVSALEGDITWHGLQPTKIREHITHRAEAA
ncbi:glutaredoxin family protein [Arthrobacter sp. yr096]|uniref:glutaredoxin family protein n=1 Tax=Arthrobacter sp. yr096 TaxID=1761750 RepID=UPI0015A68DEF|nr:glutaredoxin family protein [Arthrobacter sp. yr096]